MMANTVSAFAPASSWGPELSYSTQTFIRMAYGMLLLVHLLFTLPHARRYYLTERWRGYARDVWWVRASHNPIVMPVMLCCWMGCAVCLIAGRFTVEAGLLNLLLCRHLFVDMRWSSILRGLGAPGFLTYWCGAAVCLLEVASRLAPDVRQLVMLVFQVDFALIILSSGIYKASSGYRQNEGMEYGMVNSMWGYWWKFFASWPTNSRVFWVLDQSAWSLQILAAILMLLPPTRLWGGALMFLSFAWIATQIRLAALCPMVMLACLLFVPPDTLPDDWIARLMEFTGLSTVMTAVQGPPILSWALSFSLWSYLLLLPVAHGALFINFYARKRFPELLQRCVELYTNLFGIIIWRVFSADHTSFLVRVYLHDHLTAARREISTYDRIGSRFNHVGEAITLTTIFTSLKYYPSNSSYFAERILRYVRTIPCSDQECVIFQYIAVLKSENHFQFHPVCEFSVDSQNGRITTCQLSASMAIDAVSRVSPVFEGARPGSYAPQRDSSCVA